MIEYLRTLLLFYRRHLRIQPLRELMAVVGVAAGVALLFAIQVAHRSITGSFEHVARDVAGRATLELAARGPEGFDEHVLAEVERMPSVLAAAPLLEQTVVAVGPTGRRALTLVGATEQMTALGGALPAQFLRAGESSRRGLIVLTARTAQAIGARTGMPVEIIHGEHAERVPIAAVIPSDQSGALAESPIAAAPLPVVQSLGDAHARISRILVAPERGKQAAVDRALQRRFGTTLNVRSVTSEATLLGRASGPEEQVTFLFSAISLVTGAILAYNALLLASDERRRFIVYLIESGTPDSMVVASLAFDACLLGLAGSLIGLVAGNEISLLAYRAVPGYIAAAFPIGGQRVVGTSTVAIAFAGGMLAALAAALLPAVLALRRSAAAEPAAFGRTIAFTNRLRSSDTLVFTCGALLVCCSIIVSALEPQTTVVALVAMASGLVVCLPLALRGLLSLARAASRSSNDPAARIAVAELRGSPTRSVALLATGTIAVFLMVLIGGAVSDVQHAVRKGASDLLSGASVWIKPGGPENVYTTEPFAFTDTQRRLAAVGDVRAVMAWRDSFLDLPGRRVWVIGVPPQQQEQIAPSQLIDGSLAHADQMIRRGGWVALSQTIAREEHLRLGQYFKLPTPSGIVRVRLAATTANYGWLSGAIIMNSEEHAWLWKDRQASQLGVTLKPYVTAEQGKRAIEDALPKGSALAVKTRSERRAEVSTVLGSTLSRLSDTTIVVLIATVLSVIALMSAAIWQRRERLDSLVSIGMSTTQITRLIFFESGAVLLAGGLIGMAAGLTGQYLIDGWLHQTTGSPVAFAPAWQIGLRSVGIVAALSAVAACATPSQVGRFQLRASLEAK